MSDASRNSEKESHMSDGMNMNVADDNEDPQSDYEEPPQTSNDDAYAKVDADADGDDDDADADGDYDDADADGDYDDADADGDYDDDGDDADAYADDDADAYADDAEENVPSRHTGKPYYLAAYLQQRRLLSEAATSRPATHPSGAAAGPSKPSAPIFGVTVAPFRLAPVPSKDTSAPAAVGAALVPSGAGTDAALAGVGRAPPGAGAALAQAGAALGAGAGAGAGPGALVPPGAVRALAGASLSLVGAGALGPPEARAAHAPAGAGAAVALVPAGGATAPSQAIADQPRPAAAYALHRIPPPQQPAYQITDDTSSPEANYDYFYDSVEQQRNLFASLNSHNPQMPSQGNVSLPDEDVPLPSTVMRNSLPLMCNDSLHHRNAPYSASADENLPFSSLDGNHLRPNQRAASMLMFNSASTAQMGTMNHRGFPLPIQCDTSRQPGPSTVLQSGCLGMLPTLTERGASLRYPSASHTNELIPEVSMAAQQIESYQQNCPPMPMQIRHSLTAQNISVPMNTWQSRPTSLLRGPSMQMTNDPHMPQGSFETHQEVHSHSLSTADNSAVRFMPPYPHPSVASTATNLQHDLGPFQTIEAKNVWFQGAQQLPFTPQLAGSSMKPSATAHSSFEESNREEDNRAWSYGSSAQRAIPNEAIKDRNGRDNERPYKRRSRSHSPPSNGSRGSRYRPRRRSRSPKVHSRRDSPNDSCHSQCRKLTSCRSHSRNRDESYSSQSTDERRSRSPKGNRRSQAHGECHHSRADDEVRHSRILGCRRECHSPGARHCMHSPSSCGSTGAGERRHYAGHKGKEKGNNPCTAVRDDSYDSSPEREIDYNRRRMERYEQFRNESFSDHNEMQRQLEGLIYLRPEDILQQERNIWTRSSPSDLYYTRVENHPTHVRGTQRLNTLTEQFQHDLLERAERARGERPHYSPPPRRNRMKLAKHKSEVQNSSDTSSGESSTDEESCTMEELERKRLHPYRLHPEMWYNDPGEMNDGPLCRCSAKARRYGIRHGIYAGENHLEKCDPETNNVDKLFHYRIMISPPTNFLTKLPTVIKHDEHEFIFEGFSMLSHAPLDELPTCKVIRFNIEYTILYIEEKFPENFTIKELDLFFKYLFHEILELVDLDFRAHGDKDGCPQFHFMPRFVRELKDNGREILSMNEVLSYLLANSKPLIEEKDLSALLEMPQFRWQNFADEVKGMVVTNPGMKPCSVRVDQLDRDQPKEGESNYPEIVHFGIRPPQLSYAGNPEYQKAWREYVKFRHLLANMSKPSYDDKRKLESKEMKLQEMRTQTKMKRDVTVAVSAKGFHRTGIMCDVVQHAMLIPVLVCHLRFHRSCDILEKEIGYRFNNRFLLQLALTHPSYRENFGTNPDHARNSLTNCGIRQPEYGDRRIHYLNTRKRGINTLINIMSRFGKKTETESNITHNERLEFLGDAVVEFLSSIHLFHMFPDLEEGGLATYRAAIVQNQHLAVLAKYLNLEAYMLYAHGSDLCHDLELRHAMANCFEALMGALFLDGGIEAADKVFGETLFKYDPHIMDIWTDYPPHPLQQQEPEGDRKWIPSFDFLQKLTKFEDATGIEFKHIRLLARAFTDRSIGYTNLTLGSNQRLEFLGDTVLQLIASEYLYKHFPEHHEGHLSLLRSSLVNNRTQAVVCDDLGMTEYAVYANPKIELKTKDRADLLEAFLGALYVDQGMEHCQVFCNVCFFPRLQQFIMNQDWNDPKSKLQQCCLTLRTMDGREPDIPVYKVIECKGPTNTRVYTVAVYFRGSRLAKASGHSIQQAEMNAAKKALDLSHGLFPQLDHQKRVIAKSLWKQKRPKFPLHRDWDDDRDRNEREVQRMSDSDRSSIRNNREPSSNPEHFTTIESMNDPGTSGGKNLDNTLPNDGIPTTPKKRKRRNRRKKGTSETFTAPPSVNYD